MSHEDIGVLEGISANNVGTILYRARSRWLEKYQSLLNTSIGLPSRNNEQKSSVEQFSSMFQVLNQQMSYS